MTLALLQRFRYPQGCFGICPKGKSVQGYAPVLTLSWLLFRVQELVDVGLECVERERPDQEFDGFDLRTVSLSRAEEEGRCARHADFLTLFQTGIDRVGVFATAKTGLEGLYVQPQCLDMLLQRLGLQQLLIVEQALVHRLAFP